MARSGANRPERVSRSIQQVLAEALGTRVADPRLRGITLTRVVVTRDLSVATVSWTFTSDDPSEEQVSTAEEGFRAAGGRLRSIVSAAVRMRSTPDLRFVFDRGLAHSRRMEELLEGLKEAHPTTDDGSE